MLGLISTGHFMSHYSQISIYPLFLLMHQDLGFSYAALGLIVTLIALALIFVQLNAGFLGAVQVIVYAGAIMVLFVFIIMLLNLGDDGGRRIAMLPSKIVGGLVLAAVFAATLAALRTTIDDRTVGEAPEGYGSIESVGRSLFGEYVLPFELSGVLLLAAILGTIVLARKKP